MDKYFWRGCFERAVKTFVQTFVATLGVGAGVVYTVDSVRGLPWLSALITAGVAAVLSVATSLGSPGFVAGNHPRFPDLASEDPELIAAALDVPADDPGMIEPADDTAPTDDETGSVAVARHAEV
ncbi:holin [Cutibacterium avidum]|uniref:holin n=1 Tax=Cutibacterium avidum TaxID=33010 RepID=UPI0009B765CE|nr:holin [Cutibacterium avidum]